MRALVAQRIHWNRCLPHLLTVKQNNSHSLTYAYRHIRQQPSMLTSSTYARNQQIRTEYTWREWYLTDKENIQLTLRPLLHSPGCVHNSVIVDRTNRISDKTLIVAILWPPWKTSSLSNGNIAFQNKSRKNIKSLHSFFV